MKEIKWIDSEKYQEICKQIPIPAVDLVVVNNKYQVLLLRRAVPPVEAIGTWCLPGGGIMIGETPLDTAKRKLLEETGLEASSFIESGHAVTYMFKGKQNIAIGMIVWARDFEVKMNYEHNDYKWVAFKDLPVLMLPSTVEQVRICMHILGIQ